MLIKILDNVADTIIKNSDYLTDLDRAIGDGDHGVNIARGFSEIKAILPTLQDASVSVIFQKVGMTLLTKVGGASGAIYGTAFMSAANFMKDKENFNDKIVVELLNSMIEGIQKRGKAEIGEKTMLDTVIPTYEFIKEANDKGISLVTIEEKIIKVAREGKEKTKNMIATKGRASYLGERSVGHIDPGAESSFLIIEAICKSI